MRYPRIKTYDGRLVRFEDWFARVEAEFERVGPLPVPGLTYPMLVDAFRNKEIPASFVKRFMESAAE